MNYPFRNRVDCMEKLRSFIRIDPWFASYAVEQLAIELDIRQLNALVEGMATLLDQPEGIANPRVEALVRERFPKPE